MGNLIKLHFIKTEHLVALLDDKDFFATIEYLNPKQIDNNTIALLDPIREHSTIDTEEVVLSAFAKAIKRVLFPETNHPIEFLNPQQNQQKGGLAHHGDRIIDSTDIEILPLT